jgi:hypothetical protein
MKRRNVIVLVGVLLMATVGCSVEPIDEVTAVPAAETDTVESQQVVYSTVAGKTWSSTAWTPTGSIYDGVTGGGTFEARWRVRAGENPSRRMGACLLKQGTGGAGVTCNTTADCNNSPSSLPAGGFRYCVAPDGVGAKKCYFRPGPASSYCAGTPALPGNPPVAPGNYATPTITTGVQGKWISYGCFEGCSATDPSSSSLGHIVSEGNCGGGPC